MRVLFATIAALATMFVASTQAKADAVPPGELYIAERAIGVIKSYTTTGQLIDNALVEELAFPQGVAVLDNDLYVTNGYYGTIGKYEWSGNPINTKLISGLSDPAGMAIGGDDLFVANRETGVVGKYSTSGGTVNANFISGLDKPTGLALYGDRLYVSSPNSNKIGVYNAITGATINASLVSVRTPQSIVVTGDHLYVAVYLSNIFGGVAEYNPITGEALSAGFAIGIPQAYGLALLGNSLYVGSRSGGTVSWYDTTTRALQGSISGLDNPYGIAVAAPVPEPSTYVLAVIGVTLLLIIKRPKR